jgi:hypothetical protein
MRQLPAGIGIRPKQTGLLKTDALFDRNRSPPEKGIEL